MAHFLGSLRRFSLSFRIRLPIYFCTFTLIFLITGTNYALAVQMVFSFKTPKELIQAAQATLVRKLKLDEKRAEKIHSFCRSLFQPDMTKRN